MVLRETQTQTQTQTKTATAPKPDDRSLTASKKAYSLSPFNCGNADASPGVSKPTCE
jgi:hypothetical protein